MSSTETHKLKAKLAALVSSFDELEEHLAPLFAHPLPETLVDLEPLQQAKLQTAIPYVVYDLVFIYLKSRGIDPRTHPVISELDRIREYFEKISSAENPPAKRAELDKAAAGRFIKHAIAQAQWKKTAAEELQDTASSSATRTLSLPVKVTQKMRERAAYEKSLREADAMQGSDEEDGLEVFDGDHDVEHDVERESMRIDVDVDVKGKGKAVAPPLEATASNKNKRRRPVVDPFAGYGDDAVPSTSSGFKKVKSSSVSPPPRDTLTQTTSNDSTDAAMEPTSPLSSMTMTMTMTDKSKSASKKSKKKSKKLAS